MEQDGSGIPHIQDTSFETYRIIAGDHKMAFIIFIFTGEIKRFFMQGLWYSAFLAMLLKRFMDNEFEVLHLDRFVQKFENA